MELIDYVWNRLEPAEEEGQRGATDALLNKLYQGGFVDTRRFSALQWKNAWQKLAKSKGVYRLQRADLDGLKSYLFAAAVKRPFEPRRLKEGTRPLDWTAELYQKVLRFETTLPIDAWKKVVQTQILPKCKKGENIMYNQTLMGILEAVLQQHASPLRRLELWYHFEREPETPIKPEAGKEAPAQAKAAPVAIRDAFVAKPDESMKRTAIDKLYFHHGEHPKVEADQESLDFLDELAHLADPEDPEGKL